MRVVGVRRALRFSPHNEANDLAILQAVVDAFGGVVVEEEADGLAKALAEASLVFTMGRTQQALCCLAAAEREGVLVLNPAKGVRNCNRKTLDLLARRNNISVPPVDGEHGYWLKRADVSAQNHSDIVFCASQGELEKAREEFVRQGITDYLVQAHLQGDLVKFYGVSGTGFFRVFYPGDDGLSKFGDEAINGRPHHYDYDMEALQQMAEQMAVVAECPVYGGDAVISPTGSFAIIDFNDWPSFSRCRDEAARAICQLAEKIMAK